MSKLIKCKTCGDQIARTAKVCPHCGAKNTCRSTSQAVGCLIVLVFVFAGFGALSDKKDEVKNVKKTLSELTEQGVKPILSQLADQEKEVKKDSMTPEEKIRREKALERQEYFMNCFRTAGWLSCGYQVP